MSRLAVLSIVLTLAVGPESSLLCLAWCEATPVSEECGHAEVISDTTVAGFDCCADGPFAVSAFLREDARLGVSAPRADHAVLVPLYQLGQSTTETRPGYEPGRDQSVEARPLPAVLRI